MNRILYAILLLAGAAAIGAPLPARAQAGTCITCLGTLTHDTIPYTPLGRYSRSTTAMPRRHGKPLVLYVGALSDGDSAAERWALVKALTQFGSFTRVQATTSNPAIKGQPNVKVPTFFLVHAGYRSSYVAFDHREILDSYGHRYQKLSVADSTLVRRFQYLPVIIAGSYYLSRPMVLPQEFKPFPNETYSFVQVRAALGQNYSKLDDLGQLISDINSETNILTAVICRADGGKPAKVCGNGTIQKLLKHIS
jgi:hypothetical protein